MFFDPNNGVEVKSVPRGAGDSPKFVFRDEVAATYGAGHSVLLYQHFPRQERQSFLEKTRAALVPHAPDAHTWVFRTVDLAYLLLAQPRHAEKIGLIVSGNSVDWPGFLKAAIQPPAIG